MRRRVFFLIVVTLIFFVIGHFYLKFFDKDKLDNSSKNLDPKIEKQTTEEKLYNYSSSILENVKYSSSDPDGNLYTITASEGEIDIKDNQIIFLKNIKAVIKLKNSDNIIISSNFGKYDTNTLDTVFTKNVIIEYLNNKIIGEYLDFSISRNSMIVSKNVVFTNDSNILKTDVIEIDIQTRDVKFFMYDKDKKVSLIKNN